MTDESPRPNFGRRSASTPPPPPQPQQPPTAAAGPQPWTAPGAPAPVPAPKGVGLAVAAVILGLLGLVVPFLPMDLTGVRAYVAFPFALPGLALGVLGCVGPRRGKPLAVVGAVVSGLALVAGMIMVAGSVVS